MKLAIIGSGYVGLTTGTCLAEVGHQVICVDNNAEKVAQLRQGRIPIYEPGLEELIRKNVANGRLQFTDSIAQGVDNSEVVFIAVPTPPRPDGSVDLSFIEKVAREIAAVLKEYRVVVDKSTVPVRTGEKVKQTIQRYCQGRVDVDVVSNPEFLREGSAVSDLMKPDRIVIGAGSERAIAIMKEVYAPFNAPILVTDLNSAELIKHASNSFLALKISYINAISRICEATGANVDLVAQGMGADHRIGRAFLNAGLGYGGSCFPKDLSAFIRISEELGIDFRLLKEVSEINDSQKQRFLTKVEQALWVFKEKRIGLLGLAFKGDTDDVRNSIAMDLAEELLKRGAEVTAYDPQGMEKASQILPALKLASDAEAVAEGADCLIVATEWKEFRDLDWTRIKQRMISPLLFDGRNLLEPQRMRELGFVYTSVGR